MSKRKRQGNDAHSTSAVAHEADSPPKVARTAKHADVKTTPPVIQIVTGSYERVLHGITAAVLDPFTDKVSVQFADSFLFNAHDASIRCLALSPVTDISSTESQTVLLATGGSDEKINVYTLAASPMSQSTKLPTMPTLGNNKIDENPLNRELGSLLQHSSNVTALQFPTRSKLISASEDNTIAISRTRDLVTISTVKAPRPKAHGQPSGDTAPIGATPAGINDFAVHPSMRLMVSVGRGEKCMRLWNLVTGKKAGVLNFSKNVLQSVKEGKHSSGEGRRIRWNPAGTKFAVAFERGVVVFGEDSKPRCKAVPLPLTKVHQLNFLDEPNTGERLAVSTEDGRIVFFDTVSNDGAKSVQGNEDDDAIADAKVLGQLGGKNAGINGRIKDFAMLSPNVNGDEPMRVIVTGSSDGAVRVWQVSLEDLDSSRAKDGSFGKLIGTYDTGNRITCLSAFLMLAPTIEDDLGFSDFDGLSEGAEESSSDSDEEDEANED